jgi:hypothetical protein
MAITVTRKRYSFGPETESAELSSARRVCQCACAIASSSNTIIQTRSSVIED